MELLSPAGNLEKLITVYKYGADAAYIGIENFSLRQKADNFTENEFNSIKKIKGNKKLYGAFNISFHNKDLTRLEEKIEEIKKIPFDAFIISDIGTIPILKKYFPKIDLHLSTQANCINKEAARIYQQLGFSRIILGREASLSEIKEIKKDLPDLEIETFIHGAMCLAYSGRCFLSRYMTGRSANKGNCSHTCRWQYNLNEENKNKSDHPERKSSYATNKEIKNQAESGMLSLEEELRPGEKFPIYENKQFTTILSSRDLCLIDHLKELADAGIDSFKIEGRMKSTYYAAVITRAYRKALDQINGIQVPNLDQYKEEIFKVSHREFTTGFFFNDTAIQSPTTKSYLRQHTFIGTISETNRDLESGQNLYKINLKNQIRQDDEIEIIGPNFIYKELNQFELFDENMKNIIKSDHGKETWIKTKITLETGCILRRPIHQKEKPENSQISKKNNLENSNGSNSIG